MKTYKYRFPAYGQIGDNDEAFAYKELLEKNLTQSPDCLGSWCIFPSENPNPLDRVSFDMDEKGNVNAVNLYTYTELWEGREDDLKSCLEKNLASTSQVYWQEAPNGVVVTGDMEKPMEKSNTQTYVYRFPVSGDVDEQRTFAAYELGKKLKNGPDCLAAYCIFPTDSDILDHVSVEIDGNNLTAIDLHTYTEVWEGGEDDLRDCVAANMSEVFNNVEITGPVQCMGLEGELPKTLYHIADRKDLDSIMEKGLIPATGSNNYKNMEDHVYLSTEKDLAPWLAILKHVDNPVILEVQTDKVKGLEQGRVFNDRKYIPDKYTEYRTKEVIPASAVKETRHTRGVTEFDAGLVTRMSDMLDNAYDPADIAEVGAGLQRLEHMGILNEHVAESMLASHQADMHTESSFSSTTVVIVDESIPYEDEGLPWDPEDNGRDVVTEEDDFTKAVESLPCTQMTLADYGIK